MKTPLCLSILSLLASAAFAADPTPAKPVANPTAEVTGKATVTIEVNGQKVTREIDLGKATQITSGTTFTTSGGATTTSGSTSIINGTGSTLKNAREKLKALAEVRTWLGVISDEPSADLRSQLPIPNGTGLLIRDVAPDSAAAKAGLEKNDVLVRLDDQILTNPDQLRTLTGMKKAGDTVHVTYLRKGQEVTVEARLGTHTDEEPASKNMDGLIAHALQFVNGAQASANPLTLNYSAAIDKDGNLTLNADPNPPDASKTGGGSNGQNEPEKAKAPAEMRTWLGVAADEPSADLRAQFPAPDGTGLLVRSVVADSPAAKAGLETNDILVRLDDQLLTNPDQLRKLIGTKKDGDTVRLAYLRKGRETSVEVKLQAHAEDDAGNLVSSYANWILKKLQKGLKTEGDSKVLILQDTPGTDKDKTAFNAQWSLFTGNVQADVSEQINKLDKTLRDAGLNEEAIAQAKKAVAEAVGKVQKALSNAGENKPADDAKHAQPAPPAPSAEKAP